MGRADPGLVTVRLSELLGLEVRTESGERLGHVYDVRGELRARSLDVTGLIVGSFGILERLGLGSPGSSARIRAHDTVAWSAVVRADRRGVVVRDGTRLGS
jgi:sporulation protein YlmC with PRC-barrel domain